MGLVNIVLEHQHVALIPLRSTGATPASSLGQVGVSKGEEAQEPSSAQDHHQVNLHFHLCLHVAAAQGTEPVFYIWL